MESNEVPSTLLEEIKEIESAFNGDKLAFDLACVLAEAGADDEVLKVEEIAKYLDSPQVYGLKDIIKLQLAIKDKIDSLKHILQKINLKIRHSKLLIMDGEQIWGYKIEELSQKSLTNGKRRHKRKGLPFKEVTSFGTSILKESWRKIGFAKLIWDFEHKEQISNGELFGMLLKDCFSADPFEVVEQIIKEIEAAGILNKVTNHQLRIENPIEVVQEIARIAEAINYNFGTVIDALVTTLPDLPEPQFDEDGKQIIIYNYNL